jgi:hypothetical protein
VAFGTAWTAFADGAVARAGLETTFTGMAVGFGLAVAVWILVAVERIKPSIARPFDPPVEALTTTGFFALAAGLAVVVVLGPRYAPEMASYRLPFNSKTFLATILLLPYLYRISVSYMYSTAAPTPMQARKNLINTAM